MVSGNKKESIMKRDRSTVPHCGPHTRIRLTFSLNLFQFKAISRYGRLSCHGCDSATKSNKKEKVVRSFLLHKP